MKKILKYLSKRMLGFSFKSHQKKENSYKNLEINQKIFKQLDFNVNEVSQILSENGLEYNNGNLSWHYHIFAGLKGFCLRKNITIGNILEIGTHDGKFANYLSKIYKDSKIYTIDLPQSDTQFINSNDRESPEKLSRFLSIRKENLEQENIIFIELNSIYILNYFKQHKFDAIWVDGDHLNPQVTIDLINCISLLNPNGFLFTDDVILDLNHKKNDYVSNESYITLKHLESNRFIENYFVNKRIHKNGKYVSISKLI